MERKNGWLMKAMPFLLIVLGFLSLNMLPPIIGGGCIVLGIVMLIERKWPENWDSDNEIIADK